MELQKLKEMLVDNGYGETVVFESPDFASAFIGVSEDGRAIYQYDLMVTHLMRTDGMNELEAMEFIDYNSIRALPYQENAPIVLYRLLEN